MIVSASYKTDIPAFYGAWFLNRLAAGHAVMTNPYSQKPIRVSLRREDVDGFVFWTRNLGPFFPALDTVRAMGFPFVVQYTVTGYPRALEARTIAAADSLAHIRRLAGDRGPRAGVWRYDPIVFSSLTPPAWHEETFAALARGLAGAVDEVVVSFAEIYRKTARNLAAAARAHGFTWWDPEPEEKRVLLARLVDIAQGYGLRLSVCGQPGLTVAGAGEAACIDADRLAAIAGQPLEVPHTPHRPVCRCWSSRDIGEYDTCPHGCSYCYAVAGRIRARERHRGHDPMAESLAPSKLSALSPPNGTVDISGPTRQ